MSAIDPDTARFDPQQVLSFDLETTSANPRTARIVTSALVRISPDGVDKEELLADPGIEIPAEASNIHGISTEYAREHGKAHEEVLAYTIRKIQQAWEEGATLIVYNAAYDLSVLRHLQPDFLVTGPVYDPYVMDRALDKRKGKRTLTAVCEHYGVTLDNAHEATSDALAAARVAWKQAKSPQYFAEKIASMSLNELMEFQTVEHYEYQKRLKEYFASQGRDASNVNLSWPLATGI